MIPPTGGPGTPGPLFFPLRSAVDAVDRASFLVVVAAMAGMAALVSIQVFFRYALSDSIDWADEVSRMAFVWSIFIAIPLGIREGAHVGIDLLTNRLPRPLARQINRVMLALAFVLLCVVVYESVIVAYQTWSERLGAINISSSYFFVAVIVGSAHGALHMLHLVLHPLEEHGPDYPID